MREEKKKSLTGTKPKRTREEQEALDAITRTSGAADRSKQDAEKPARTKLAGKATIRKIVVREAVESLLLVPYDPEVKKQQQAAAAKAAANAARAAHVAKVRLKNWPQDIEKAVLDGKVKIGMTNEQVTFAWGKPRKVNRTIGRWGTHEQWVYGDTYLYFENGILTALQDSR